MDLNNFDFSNLDDDDHTSQGTPNFDLNLNSRNYIPTFTELISDIENLQNFDDFGNPMSLSQLPTEKFVEGTPSYCATKSKKPSSSKKGQKTNENRVWSEKEDEALMSAWCLVSNDLIVGKNQNNYTRWKKVFDLYKQARVENKNQNQLRVRSVDAMKSRFQRLNYVVNKWVCCYNQVISRPPNTQFGVSGNISGTSSKRSISDVGSSPSSVNIGTPTSTTPSTVNVDEYVNLRPEGREAAKKKRKGKSPTSESMFSDQDVSLLEGHRIATETQVQQRERRIEADLKIEELRLLKIKTKMEMTMLNTLLSRQDLNAKDQEMKEKLQNKYMSEI
ncbi:hypothetical protein RND81_12G043700 [Saponaria officinalis]|uniref:No apical meristem-associated C-terminal domain-containing protein n=1 Tax=Saponaria officinalis TaxID=3572 RepID=A0AAW1H341_SAPOF